MFFATISVGYFDKIGARVLKCLIAHKSQTLKNWWTDMKNQMVSLT